MRLGAIVLLGIVWCVGMGVQGQAGLPDLTLKTLRISPGDLEEGQPSLVRAVIANQGQGDAQGSFDILFELDGREFATRSLGGLKKDQAIEVQVPWRAELGSHTLKVSVDAPFNAIRESNESNNKFFKKFTVLPMAGVRSFSLDLIKLFGRTLDEAGAALDFKLTDNVFTSLGNAVRAINDLALALRNVSVEFPLVRGLVPPALATDLKISDAEVLVALFEAMAESWVRIGGMLSIGNFDGVLENASVLARQLVELSHKSLARVSFAPLGSALARFDRVMALATELRNLLKGAQGRSQYEVAVELFNAFIAFGAELSRSGRIIIQDAQRRSARFSNGDEPIDGAIRSTNPLVIEWPGIMFMRIELYELTSGMLLFRSEEQGPWLEMRANGSLATGMYGYKLVGVTKQGRSLVEVGRLQIKQTSTTPFKHDAPMGMSGH